MVLVLKVTANEKVASWRTLSPLYEAERLTVFQKGIVPGQLCHKLTSHNLFK